MADINLLPEEERTARGQEQLHKRLVGASISALGLVAFLAIATLAFSAKLGSDRASLNAQIEDATSRINSFRANEELVLVIKDKTENAQQILSGRTDLTNIFSQLSSLVPSGISFTDLKIQADKIIIIGRARTSSDVAGLVSLLVGDLGREVISGVTVESLNTGEGGVYLFNISASLVKKQS